MLRSMTAFGRALHSTPVGRFVVEVQSVNRKFLEINLYLPSEFARFEAEIRRWISSSVTRGQINLKLTAVYDVESPVKVGVNIPLAKQIKNACQELAKAAGLSSSEELTIRMLSSHENILISEESEKDEEYLQSIHQAVEMAMKQFLSMKDFEGKQLLKDIQDRLSIIQSAMQNIIPHTTDAVQRYREKLKERIEEVTPGAVENEERILREVCLYADKCDITEEITRFESHLKHFDKILHSTEVGIGKTLEFLLQELGREVNTIASKSNDASISQSVVSIKSELERIREQVQNVE